MINTLQFGGVFQGVVPVWVPFVADLCPTDRTARLLIHPWG